MKLTGNWNLVFEDDFASNTVNRNVWSLRGDKYIAGMTQCRADWSAVDVSNKILRLKVIKDPAVSGNYLAGHIGTEDTFEFTHGYVEARARFQPYRGAHSAIWLQGTDAYAPGQAEIDVAEYFGTNNPDRSGGTDVWHNVYWPDADGTLLNDRNSTNDVAFFGDSTRWHNSYNLFGVKWTAQKYTYYINDKIVYETTAGATSSPKYVVLSVISRDYEVGNIQPSLLDTYKLDVDWVRVWQLSR